MEPSTACESPKVWRLIRRIEFYSVRSSFAACITGFNGIRSDWWVMRYSLMGPLRVVGGGHEKNKQTICRLAATGSCLIPDSLDDLTWRIGNHGFEMNLGAKVPNHIREHLRPWLEAWLSEQGHSLDIAECVKWYVARR